jgi:hypothetical protein
VAGGFASLAGVTAGDISLDELPELGPVEGAADQFTGLEDAKVSRGRVIVTASEDIAFNVIVAWDYNATFVEYEAIVQGVARAQVLVGCETNE